MQLETGDWVYYPDDSMPAIYKLQRRSLDREGRHCFVCEVFYIDSNLVQEEWLSRLEDFGPGIVARTKEEKRMIELLVML